MNLKKIAVASAMLAFAAAASAITQPLPVPERGFISSTPGETWEQGLLSGNGTLGLNVFGNPLAETAILTHERLFIPLDKPHMPPDNGNRLFEIRNLIDRGLYKQATELALDLSGQEGFLYHDHFVPAFDLKINMDAKGEAKNTMRSVDFQTGQATIQWSDDQGTYERRSFVSRADGVAVMQIVGTEKGSVGCRLKMQVRDPHPELIGGGRTPQKPRSDRMYEYYVTNTTFAATGPALTVRQNFARAYPGSIHAMEGIAQVIATGGSVSTEGNELVVNGADQVLVLIDVEMVYDPAQSVIGDFMEQLAALPADYDALLARHAPLHNNIFSRMKLDLGGDEHHLTTEELLEKTSFEKLNRTLIEKEFDAARYNVLSSTGELPPNLQGLWAGTYVPDWASDYTHNGNVPSAIASMLMGNMPELMLSYTSYIESLIPYLEINAKHIFGARGIILPSRSTTTGYNNAIAGTFAGGFWVAGAAWASHFFYDYYLYTGDREFLVEHALPFMEKSALFFEDYLYENDAGILVFNPTQSPENTPANSDSQGSFNATMDVAAAKELLGNLIAVSEELNVNADKIPLWQDMLKKMPDYLVAEDGQLKEWLTPKLENNDKHRHSSQLYALYDGMPQEIADRPDLQDAFRKSIEYKLDKHWRDNKRGFMSFGLVQLGQVATSLENSELAYECLTHLVNRFWLGNMASMHNAKALLNMDISGGQPAVIIKMLMASEPGKIKLLPALPKEWPEGAIEGILCRGQIELKRLQWSPEKVTVEMVSGKKQPIELALPSEINDVNVVSGKASVKKGEGRNSRKVTLPANQSVTFEIKL
ncbi:hypothetical protein PDESU_00046 [Pontiella desulfatans]|uniref:Uncharacterized protein n=1 Tax=Pontiella desulfatans TaxID=2750659 RepID=A0A6C2TVG2_PONDE|nr:glycoside hydrolase N-terminal domain-containing protein [Pontiella desulfatans]VGO11502.1 hypothetical protein PDESU_00046 [Pontiella desulfatans]